MPKGLDVKINFIVKEGDIFKFEVDGRNVSFSATKSTSKIKYSRGDALDHEEILFQSLDILEQLNPEHHLFFLQTCIFVLTETQRKFIEKQYLFEKLVWFYWQTYKCLLITDRDSIPLDLDIDVCERYLALLGDDTKQDWFDRMALDKKFKTTREKEVGEVVEALKGLGNPCDKRKALSPDQNKKKRQTMDRAKEMLMAWYNIGGAMDIANRLQKSWIPFCLRHLISAWLPEIMGVVFLAYCVYFKLQYIFELKLFGFDPVICSLYFLIFCGVFFSFIKLSTKTKQVDLQIYLPRMAAGIIVGYIALLSDEAWGGIFADHEGWLCFTAGRTVLPCIAVIFYILIEMNNVKGIRYPILGKAFRLFSRGAAYAVLTGMIVSDLFGKAIVRRIPETKDVFFTSCEAKPIHLTGLFGNIYPEVIFYIAPLALFIGVFVQLLWEDKTLTAKI